MKLVNYKNSNNSIPIGKIVCVGRNYAAHAAELGNEVPEFPIIFIKPYSNTIFSGDKLEFPAHSNELHHEVELLLLIGKPVKNANFEEAEEAIAGYGVGLDMTLRDIQSEAKKNGLPWTLAKCFDGSAIISEFISKEDYTLNRNESIKLWLNDELKQDSFISSMIFSPAEIVSYISARMGLEKGDIIFTGTPEGVGKVIPGDKIHAEISNIGSVITEVTGN